METALPEEKVKALLYHLWKAWTHSESDQNLELQTVRDHLQTLRHYLLPTFESLSSNTLRISFTEFYSQVRPHLDLDQLALSIPCGSQLVFISPEERKEIRSRFNKLAKNGVVQLGSGMGKQFLDLLQQTQGDRVVQETIESCYDWSGSEFNPQLEMTFEQFLLLGKVLLLFFFLIEFFFF